MIVTGDYSYILGMIFLGFKKYSIVAVLLAISLLFVANCKPKDEPFDEGKGSPVFFISGSVDGTPMQYIAGVDSYYMYSQYRYSTTDSLYWFEANLKKTNCTTCPKSILISIADAVTSAGTSPTDINKVVQPDSFDFLPATGGTTVINGYKYNFLAEDTGYSNPQYNWDFGGLGSSTLKNPSFTFPDTQTRNVCVTVTDLISSCKNTSCNTIKPIAAGNDSCTPKFDYIALGDSAVQLINQSAGGTANWDFGDGQFSNQFFPPVHYYAKQGSYKICLTLSAQGCSQQICKTVVISDPAFTCGANFHYDSTKVNTTIIKSPRTSKVVVSYVDENGVLYKSDLQDQPAGSSFAKISTRNYDPNEKGEKNQLLNVTFKCRVFSGGGAFKDVVVTNGVVAIAYP